MKVTGYNFEYKGYLCRVEWLNYPSTANTPICLSHYKGYIYLPCNTVNKQIYDMFHTLCTLNEIKCNTNAYKGDFNKGDKNYVVGFNASACTDWNNYEMKLINYKWNKYNVEKELKSMVSQIIYLKSDFKNTRFKSSYYNM